MCPAQGLWAIAMSVLMGMWARRAKTRWCLLRGHQPQDWLSLRGDAQPPKQQEALWSAGPWTSHQHATRSGTVTLKFLTVWGSVCIKKETLAPFKILNIWIFFFLMQVCCCSFLKKKFKCLKGNWFTFTTYLCRIFSPLLWQLSLNACGNLNICRSVEYEDALTAIFCVNFDLWSFKTPVTVFFPSKNYNWLHTWLFFRFQWNGKLNRCWYYSVVFSGPFCVVFGKPLNRLSLDMYRQSYL